ncbi:hypothetical protein BJF85_10795 [Saccharomonospora sp. CUA-673]|uniref:AEC family transporter n=1 Tax=Saccharomonospora sp. CUA-673 TaxID=1904969 RepID=UPI00095BC69C|nr:AEC family transporter [Saccharomonospora sp. CUA-673]OLT48947.1 hypothetical protein BJF85_10795 [Saccharomonospora sp. CUA-673]
MNGVVEGFLVIGFVVAVGYGLGRTGALGPSAMQVLSRTAFFVGSPALLFGTLARTDVSAVFSAALLVTAVTSTVVCLLYLPIGLARRRPAGEVTVGSMASGYVNAGNLGIPIATYVLGGAAEVAPVLLFQLAVLTPVFTSVLDVQSERAGGGKPNWLRAFSAPVRNPLALASAAGIVCSATGFLPPTAVMDPVDLIGNLAVPAMLLAFGISLHASTLPGKDRDLRPSLITVVGLKTFVHPLLAWGLAMAIGADEHALLAAVVCAALPTAQNVFGYAVRFDQGVQLARDAGLASTVLALPVLVGIVALLG